MSEHPYFPHLFSQIAVGHRTLRNRVALAATLTNYGAGHRITERWINFLAERAKGGVALVITEVIAVDPDALSHGAIVTGYDRENEDGFKRVADAVEGAGACLIGQLWHPGRQQLWAPVNSPKGVSDLPDAFSWTVPHVMSTDEVLQVGAEYVSVAQRLKRCGFGGVELHGAHGYLITQFFSSWSNRRTDEYGGSLENRIRFVREVAENIRQTCGTDFLIGLKMPGDEGVPGGIEPAEASRITAALARGKVLDYYAYSQGNFSLSLENHVPDMHFSRGHFLDIHKRIRPSAAGAPVMAMGRVATPAEAEAAIAEGAADIVGLCRALIADADWAKKARDGHPAQIRPSTYDNVAWGEVQAGRPLEEANNPQLARLGESDWTPPRAEKSKRIVVIGAGPAGLQAAWIASARGHSVTLFGTSEEIGGKLCVEAALPGGAEYGELLGWLGRQLTRYGVDLRLGHAATIDDVFAEHPDRVVIATGSHQRVPDEFIGEGLSARDWASQKPSHNRRTGTAVLLDMDHTAGTYAVADAMTQCYGRVVLITPRTQIARNVNYCSAIGVHRRLYEGGVEVVTAAEPLALHDGVLTWRNVFTGRTENISQVSLFVWSTPRVANDAIAKSLRLSGVDVHLIGDCMSPRNLLCAMHEGCAAALAS